MPHRTRLTAGTAPALAAVTAVAAVFRLARLSGYDGLTGDEGYTFALVQRSLPDMLKLFSREANGIVYALVLFPLARLGDWLWLLRSPALLAGTLAVPALYWAARGLTSRRVALTAAALLAVNPVAISYSQLARPYAFAMLFGILAFGFLARGSGHGAGYVAAMALAAYSNGLALVLLLPAQLPLVLTRGPRAVRAWARSLIFLALAVAPLAVLLTVARSRRNALYWLDRPSLRTAENVLIDFGGGKAGLVFAFLVAAAGTVLAVRRSGLDESWWLAGGWGLIPLPLLFLFAQITPSFWIGYTLPALPGVLFLVARSAERLPRAAGAVAVAAFATILLRASLVNADSYHPSGWREAAAALAPARDRDEPLLFDIPDGLVAAGYYLPSLAAPNDNLVVSEWRDEPLPRRVVLLDDPGGYGRVRAGPPTSTLVLAMTRGAKTAHVLAYETAQQGDTAEWPGIVWANKQCQVRRRTFGGIQMFTIARCAPGYR